jgi:hypothetical protein
MYNSPVTSSIGLRTSARPWATPITPLDNEVASGGSRGSLKYYQDARSNYKSALEAFRNMRASSKAHRSHEPDSGDPAISANTTLRPDGDIAGEIPKAFTSPIDQSSDYSVAAIVDELKAILKEHNPASLTSLDDKLRKYAGREQELLEIARNKYLGLIAASGSASMRSNKASNYSGAYAFMDFSINGAPASRMKFKLYDDETPLASNNFKMLCTGEKVEECFKTLCYFLLIVHVFLCISLALRAPARERGPGCVTGAAGCTASCLVSWFRVAILPWEMEAAVCRFMRDQSK